VRATLGSSIRWVNDQRGASELTCEHCSWWNAWGWVDVSYLWLIEDKSNEQYGLCEMHKCSCLFIHQSVKSAHLVPETWTFNYVQLVGSEDIKLPSSFLVTDNESQKLLSWGCTFKFNIYCHSVELYNLDSLFVSCHFGVWYPLQPFFALSIILDTWYHYSNHAWIWILTSSLYRQKGLHN
jgi:hypothetical protein